MGRSGFNIRKLEQNQCHHKFESKYYIETWRFTASLSAASNDDGDYCISCDDDDDDDDDDDCEDDCFEESNA